MGCAWPATAERLWSALGEAWGPPRPLAASLPFATSFDQGAGERLYLEVPRPTHRKRLPSRTSLFLFVSVLVICYD